MRVADIPNIIEEKKVLFLVFILFLSEVDVAGYLIVEKLSDKAYLVHKLAFFF